MIDRAEMKEKLQNQKLGIYKNPHQIARENDRDEFKKMLNHFFAREEPRKLTKGDANDLLQTCWPKKTGPWPEKHDWFSSKAPQWLKDKKQKYKCLAPLLAELYDCKNLSNYNGTIIVSAEFEKEVIKRPEGKPSFKKIEKYNYALIKMTPSLYEHIAKMVKCSPSSVKKYLGGLVDCDLVKSFNMGAKGHYYSIRYWSKGYIDKETKERRHRKIPFLNKDTCKQLKTFKPRG